MSAPGPAAPPALTLIAGGKGKRRTVWCKQLPGFGQRHHPSGRSSFIVQTVMGGRTRVVTLGRAGVISEGEARAAARLILLQAQDGRNVADARRHARAAPSFADFLDAYWRRAEPTWKPSTADRHRYYRRCHLDGAFAGQFIDAIDTPAVQRWFVAVADKAGPGAANRVLAMLSALFGRAEAWGYRLDGSNPCRGIRRYRQQRFGRALEPAEIARLGAALDATATAQPLAAALVRLLLLTGCRLSELLSLEWREVRGARLQLRDAKSGPRTVWLGAEAQGVLANLPHAQGQRYVFASGVTDRPLVSPHRYWRKVLRLADLPTTRLHDLRHSFASHAARGAETMPVIGRLLGHGNTATTGRYARLDDASLLAAAEQVGRVLIARCKGNAFYA